MKLHLCCGSVYLKDYWNCDIDGLSVANLPEDNYSTTLDKYFKFPFEKDETKRVRSPFVIDQRMNVLEQWPFYEGNIDEIVMVSAIEHFEYKTEVPHIIKQARRVLKVGGIFKFDFPDIKKQVEEYYEKDPEFMMELIYCNRKNKFSEHKWGYTPSTIKKFFNEAIWDVECPKEVVKHDYPMTGCWATLR